MSGHQTTGVRPAVTNQVGAHESVPPVHLPVACHWLVAAAGHDQHLDYPAQLSLGLGLKLE